ncbi:hypothetical protein QYM36_019291 [Artemia franciscana]|uniref:Uncharacterized protein n=1 Tax=Artemia franciscana TaxID=6661 RepID=A0AA88H5H2_ARTSF|nr:hypothetical protein QYM36_019291 [Artemia franciscana]
MNTSANDKNLVPGHAIGDAAEKNTCNWSKSALHPEGTPDCPFPIPGVLNPNEPAINEIIDKNEISFSWVLIPEQPGETCPNGHVTKLRTLFTQAPEYLALDLDRRTLCHKITQRFIDGFDTCLVPLE